MRGNGGGNIFPMLAGIGALLGEGNSYYSLDGEGRKAHYFYENGQSGLIEPGGKQTFITKIAGPVYKLKNQTPVAIFRDCYEKGDEDLIFALFGQTPVERWDKSKQMYRDARMNAEWRLCPGVKHTVTKGMFDDIFAFFKKQITEKL